MGLNVTVDYANGVEFGVHARQHSLVCDQPIENGGSDRGLTPPELLLASLGTCAAYYAAEYMRTRRLDPSELQVRITAEKLLNPARLGNFQIVVTAPGCNDERHREGILRAAKNCLIHNTLLHSPEI
ncbi:MAG TPA: OsmC family protein, partial [Nitrospira sp.]|nr:OsmC family protein [Nitrospira sp.]